MIKIIIEIDNQEVKNIQTNEEKQIIRSHTEKSLPIIKEEIKTKPKRKPAISLNGEHPLKGKKAHTGIKKCADCEKDYKATSNAQLRCPPCAEIKKKEKK